MLPVRWYCSKVDWAKGVGALNAFARRSGTAGADTLAETAKFVGVGGVPNGLIGRMGAEVAVFEHTAGSRIQDR